MANAVNAIVAALTNVSSIFNPESWQDYFTLAEQEI
jgi:hypothetical protein